jgi:hypothetical protein
VQASLQAHDPPQSHTGEQVQGAAQVQPVEVFCVVFASVVELMMSLVFGLRREYGRPANES